MAIRSTIAVMAALIAVTACSSVDSGGDSVARSSPSATAAAPSSASPATPPASPPSIDAAPATATWSCVGEESTHTAGQLVIDIVPAADCSADVSGTVRVTNAEETDCGSDVMVNLGEARIWMESTSGYGSASGTWAPMPDDIGEAVGYVAYPPGVSEWTVRLPALSAGEYQWSFVPGVSCGNDNLSPIVDVHVVLSGSASDPTPTDLFADHQRWVATDLNGLPVVGGPVIESAATADFTPRDRLGQIAGCALDAGSWAFNLDDDKLITDPFASLDFDCDLETDPSQVDTIRRLVFEASTVEVAGRQLRLTDGSNTLTFEPETVSEANGLEPIATSPLTPRSSSVALWTGTEILVIGGEPRSTCPPGADCNPPGFAPLADGAAYDPATDTWRTLAVAPLNMSGNAQPVVVGDLVYVSVLDASYRPGGAGGFLEYDVSSDTWRQLPTPGDGRFDITRFGDTVVAFRNSDEADPAADLVFDTNSETWQPLPDDPLSPSFDRTMVSVDGELFLFAKDLVANPGSEQPSLVRTAVLDPATMTWTLRSDSEILGSESPVAVDGEVIFANSGSADGGQVNNWGRSYPYGGTYNVDSDQWRSLPAPAGDDSFQIAGVLGEGGSLATSAAGLVLLNNRELWVETPFAPFDYEGVFNQAVAATDTSIFVFGGEQWQPEATEGTLTNDAAIWTPTN